jgi:hypothetical protein
MHDTTTLDDALISLIQHYELRSLEVEPLGVENKARLKVGVGGRGVTATIRPVAGEENLLRVQVALIEGHAVRQLPRTRTRGDGPPEALPDLIEEIVGRVGAVREAEGNHVA